MYTIKHLFHIDAPESDVYNAITTIEGLKGWWTHHTEGSCDLGQIIKFNFPPRFSNSMRVTQLETNKLVSWECLEGAPDWIGTNVYFLLDRNENKTRLRFSHSGWQLNDDFYAMCCFSWGRYLESLRQLIQTGKGQPFI